MKVRLVSLVLFLLLLSHAIVVIPGPHSAGRKNGLIYARDPSEASDQQSSTTYLPLIVSPPIRVSSVLTPFDGNLDDLLGPSGSIYGKTPEIIVASNGVKLDVLAQDYDSGTPWKAVLLHIEPDSTKRYRISQALTNIPMLDRVMGLAIDDFGNRYYATGIDERALVNLHYPMTRPRSDIVRVVKLDTAGNVVFNTDLDVARYAFNHGAGSIVNPMVASTARLLVGGNEIVLVHGNNTEPIDGVRHQVSLTTRLNAESGGVIGTSGVYASHAFDHRLLYDGERVVTCHLGDAYPRAIICGWNFSFTFNYRVFRIKGNIGENNTYTRLGNAALIENDPDYRYIVLFATESNARTEAFTNGPLNLAIVRMGKDGSVDPSLPDALTVVSGAEPYTNRLRWLTRYTESSNLHAERPKLIGIGGNRYIVLWEEWRAVGLYADVFNGVYGMVIDERGNILHSARLITDKRHLPRGDDAFLLDNRAAWMTGNAVEKKLYLHFVDDSLNYEMVTLD